MTGAEAAGPPAPKVLRLLYFVGAGIICTAAINKWNEYERKAIQKEQLQLQQQSSGKVVHKTIE